MYSPDGITASASRRSKYTVLYRRKLVQKGLAKAILAAARKLGIRLWIMLRDQIDYEQFCRRQPKRQESGGAREERPGVRRTHPGLG